MAIAHVCMGCGLDLTRSRALPENDPHYGLPLVKCSRCGTAVVRRRHPIQRGWRAFLRILIAFLSLSARSLLLLLFTLMTLGVAHGPAGRLLENWRTFDWQASRLEVILMFLILPIMTGMWLEVAFSHWRFRLQWGALALWLLALSFLLPLTSRITHEEEWRPWIHAVQIWYEQKHGLYAIVVMLAVSLVGIVFGRMLARAFAASRRTRWRKKRNRFRRTRQGS